MTRNTNKVFIYFLTVSFLLFNYLPNYGWWISILGTALIIIFGNRAWLSNYKYMLGIPQKTNQYIYSVLILICSIAASYFLITKIAADNNYEIKLGNIYNFIHIFFYTLNEEFILGALLLFSLTNRFEKIRPLLISVIVAIIFSIVHYIFYRWVFQGNVQGILSLFTLISLFVIGVLRNNIILKTGHIGFSWALHFSWMAVMFGCGFIQMDSKHILTQTERFDLFLGNEITFIAALILAAITSISIFTSKRSKNHN